jgi:hypothetical protein
MSKISGRVAIPTAGGDSDCVASSGTKLSLRGLLHYPPIRIARFSDEFLRRSVERKKIAGTPVPAFGVAKTVADLFRYRRTVGDALAIEGLRQALRQRKATPAAIAREAEAAGV